MYIDLANPGCSVKRDGGRTMVGGWISLSSLCPCMVWKWVGLARTISLYTVYGVRMVSFAEISSNIWSDTVYKYIYGTGQP
jgi:hypothetical protein